MFPLMAPLVLLAAGAAAAAAAAAAAVVVPVVALVVAVATPQPGVMDMVDLVGQADDNDDECAMNSGRGVMMTRLVL